MPSTLDFLGRLAVQGGRCLAAGQMETIADDLSHRIFLSIGPIPNDVRQFGYSTFSRAGKIAREKVVPKTLTIIN
jgi:hypothetical protein